MATTRGDDGDIDDNNVENENIDRKEEGWKTAAREKGGGGRGKDRVIPGDNYDHRRGTPGKNVAGALAPQSETTGKRAPLAMG